MERKQESQRDREKEIVGKRGKGTSQPAEGKSIIFQSFLEAGKQFANILFNSIFWGFFFNSGLGKRTKISQRI